MNPDTTVSKMLIKGIESNHTIIKVKTKNVISYITNISKNQNITKWKKKCLRVFLFFLSRYPNDLEVEKDSY